MAKKKNEIKSEPVISSIPVPPSDSALVIDLPDGQKLLVGKIETGTVIEVATWRGTGRPDSRTNRLMLGMSNESEANQLAAKSDTESSQPRELNGIQKVLFVANNVFLTSKKYLLKVLSFIKAIFKGDVKSKLRSLPKIKVFDFPRNRVNEKSDHSEKSSFSALKIEDDFDVDFQRILDEVSQRKSSRPAEKSKTSSKKGEIGKSTAKNRPTGNKKVQKKVR